MTSWLVGLQLLAHYQTVYICVTPFPLCLCYNYGSLLYLTLSCRLPAHIAKAFGRIRHNKLVYFDGDGTALKAQLVMVRIDECNAYSLFGSMVGETLPRGVSSGLGGQRELVTA